VIRASWLASRAQVGVAAVMIVAVAAVAAVTGPGLVGLYRQVTVGCARDGDCRAALAAFATTDGTLRLWLGVLVVVAPAITGAFWGAPLVASELEDGTFRLTWTQGVTRTRWLAGRLAVTGLAGMSTAGLLSLVVSWWASPLDQAGLSRFATFDQRDIVPVGYAAFAVALGVTAGAVIRRTLPAMAVTIVVFIAARMAVTYWVRPQMLAPLTLARSVRVDGYGFEGFLPIGRSTLQLQPPDLPNAWVTSIDLVARSGNGLSAADLARWCPGLGKGGPGHGFGHTQRAPASAVRALDACGARLGRLYHEAVSYQPASRYWPLQWWELVIFLAAAAGLAGLAIWRVRRLG
jgi:hypothetical protein